MQERGLQRMAFYKPQMPQDLEFSVRKGGGETIVPRPWRAVTTERGFGAPWTRDTWSGPLLPYWLVSTLKRKGHSWNLTVLIPFFIILCAQNPTVSWKSWRSSLKPNQTIDHFPKIPPLPPLGWDSFTLFLPHWPLALTSAHPNSTHCLCYAYQPLPLCQQEIISLLGLHWALHTCLMTLIRKSSIVPMYLSHVHGREYARMVPKIPIPQCTHPT